LLNHRGGGGRGGRGVLEDAPKGLGGFVS